MDERKIVDRTRTESFMLMLLPEEKALLEKGAYELGYSKAEYLRNLIVYGSMYGRHWSMDKEQGKQLLYEVNRIGNNINQIAYIVNTQSHATRAEFDGLLREYNNLLILLGKIPFLDKEAQEEWQRQIFTLLPKP